MNENKYEEICPIDTISLEEFVGPNCSVPRGDIVTGSRILTGYDARRILTPLILKLRRMK